MITISPEETEALGARLAGELGGGAVVALSGDLGAGKTVFARGIARGLGIDVPVTSPTFSIVQEYRGGRLTLYHMDMYRLHGEDDALAFGIEEFLFDPEAVSVIEWAERIPTILPATTIRVNLAADGDRRRIDIQRPS